MGFVETKYFYRLNNSTKYLLLDCCALCYELFHVNDVYSYAGSCEFKKKNDIALEFGKLTVFPFSIKYYDVRVSNYKIS